MSTGLVVRTATMMDVSALAVLRWRWALPDAAPQPDALREFAAALEEWMVRQGDASVCKIAVLDGEFVGMATLAIFERVPNPDDLRRLSGDVQSVFVVPERRGLGIGRKLMEAICETAAERGLRKVTVDSHDGAVPFYQQFGFTRSMLAL